MSTIQQYQQRHIKFELWLEQWAFVLQSHKFFTSTYDFKDKRGYNRKGIEILGVDWNGYCMHPPAFPKEFVEYITNTVSGKIDSDGVTRYKIGYGKLVPLYAAYRAYSERIAVLDAVLLDLETNPV